MQFSIPAALVAALAASVIASPVVSGEESPASELQKHDYGVEICTNWYVLLFLTPKITSKN